MLVFYAEMIFQATAPMFRLDTALWDSSVQQQQQQQQ